MGNLYFIYSESCFSCFFSVFNIFIIKAYVCIKIRKYDQNFDIINIYKHFSLKGFQKICEDVIFL